MKKKTLVLIVTLITLVSIGGYGFAQGTNEEVFDNNSDEITTRSVGTRINNHCGNNEEMIAIMKENGYEDMVKWMEEGDFQAMDEFMKNMTDEDFQNMVDIMNQNGYGNMARMMESVEREGMLQMHNSMMYRNGSRLNGMRNMMYRF